MREIGARLQARARQLGLTDAEVARRLGLAQGRYSHYANDQREPDLATLVRICQQLSMTPNELLGVGEGDDNRRSATRARIDALLDGMEADRLDLALAVLTALAAHPQAPTTAKTRSPKKRATGSDQRSARPPRRKAKEV